jgi:hypothetical protein
MNVIPSGIDEYGDLIKASMGGPGSLRPEVVSRVGNPPWFSPVTQKQLK